MLKPIIQTCKQLQMTKIWLIIMIVFLNSHKTLKDIKIIYRRSNVGTSKISQLGEYIFMYCCTSPMHMMTGFDLLILLVPLLVLVSIDTATKSPSL